MTASLERRSVGPSSAYTEAGVDTELQERALEHMLAPLRETFQHRSRVGRPLLEFGPFANVLDLGRGLGLAVSIDGVGTKALIAQMMDKYDTIGIDCVAMNVNDLVCVGAEPIAMLDYIAVQVPNETVFRAIGEGLGEGARQARISIPGGEVAQIGPMLQGHAEGAGFDLVGCAVGTVATDGMIVGRDIRDGDVVVGLRSSGIHSNGLSLARAVLFEKAELETDSPFPEMARTIGEELLVPTQIYVQPILDMIASGIRISALSHITSDGLLNLRRVVGDFSFMIEHLPDPQPIFELIARLGEVPVEEMYRVYNMGVGFCIVADPSDAGRIIEVARRYEIEAFELGYAVSDPERAVHLKPAGLIGKGKTFLVA